MNTIKIKMKDTKLWAQESPALPHVLYEKDKVYDISANTALSIIRQGFGVQVDEDDDVEKFDEEVDEKMDKQPKKQNKMLKPKNKNKSKNNGK
jgi:hypothetical protein